MTQTAIITGASGYLGTQMCLGLLKRGCFVLGIGRRQKINDDRLLPFLNNKQFDYFSGDLTSAACIERIEERVSPKLNILINNAYTGGSGGINSSTATDFAASYDITVVAAHQLTAKLLPNLKRSRALNEDACILNIASMYGLVAPDIKLYPSKSQANPPFYGAAKAALIQYTRYLASELGSDGIRVNSISFGPFPKEMENDDDFIKSLAKKTMLNRIGEAEEVIGPVKFLTSSDASYITGANLIVDGGWTSW